MKKTSDWILSHEIPSDVTVHIGGASFSLHKFPLVSKCGYIRKILSNHKDSNILVIEIPDVPGGPEGFELAAKFCYGINYEFSTKNISLVRCVSEFLEMTEDYAIGNLVKRSEAYLNEVALKTLSGAITILQSSINLLPMAEKVKLITRCIDTIAYIVTKESEFCLGDLASSSSNLKAIVDWRAEDLIVLRIDVFQRVLLAMISRGFKQYALGPILMLYAQKCLQGLEALGKEKKKIDSKQEHEMRIVLETIVSLLPRERNTISVSSLSMLLRAAIYLETTMACKLDLEKRMGLQLGQAVLDDILIPSFNFDGDILFDVDTVQRIMMNYLEYELESTNIQENDMEKVGKLMESYLAEIASDRNLSLSKFMDFAEHVPEQAKVSDDGIYRAIDIYLKSHPTLSDMERKKVCSLMDCEKLSREACAHAAQNDRLPVQTVVQVLFSEQQRLRGTMGGDGLITVEPTTNKPSSHELSWLIKENQDLKFELLNMKIKLKEVERWTSDREKTGVSSPGRATRYSADKPLFPRKSFLNSVSKKLGKVMPLLRVDGVVPMSTRGRNKPSKDRRHSMS
ncbi:BTB/POZ domain-containing protein SR1IP1-like [Lactuca sativa]|uniref:BTB/POZ domain-containing protein SR1IP1-like n=1 Tax=Lactuca sativa TaxID=4236 RepID=UPI000CD8A322|nr:BTB/POZ domain-containing protein SR1IP1-like [Lactuca sativa]